MAHANEPVICGRHDKVKESMEPKEPVTRMLFERVKELSVRMERLEQSTELSDDCEEDVENRVEWLEKNVKILEVQNLELRDHLNSVVDGVNELIKFLNKIREKTHTNATPPLTVQQVYETYQTQPPTEEEWQIMTDAIKTAEEYQTTPQQQLFNTFNGLTDDEWADLLQSS